MCKCKSAWNIFGGGTFGAFGLWCIGVFGLWCIGAWNIFGGGTLGYLGCGALGRGTYLVEVQWGDKNVGNCKISFRPYEVNIMTVYYLCF